ncbi:protein phosphatase Slingshot homolog 2-like isoform X3 [Sinocyclocheilus rhinocerous]|uniref:protein phosphatase Slingshot homolog 2-like isoform X2 n=1 Tax=Sinocyclocheilus rhinocerous TaxID=307959 RepID=UPI0007BA6360|nr:PREDICTED: protein phosphatase Slingshot homolog 2-like isoform X2 [Sinocyclocheilus rhinocerous]XP_016394776.1 PREDICTED: protein phosphatase Slingshot homolog 2-like isoform X3 [Sinocyclocheilus rhinocerous]
MALVTVQRSPTPSATSSPCVSESGSGDDDRRSQPRSISESFLTVKGAALFLPRGNGSSSSSCSSRITAQRSKHAGDLQQHLQTMFTLLRPEDNIRLAVRLESAFPQCTRYMVVVSTNGRQDTEESVVLGMDFSPSDSSCSIGMVLPLWSDTRIHLDGDGGFSVSTDNKIHIFKPVSVQAMWSALQSLHKACEMARCQNYFPGSLFLTWVSYYQSRVTSDQALINEWNAMQDVQSHRADSPVLFSEVPTERERTERLIKTRLREIMMQKDLENVTSKDIRTELEMQMVCNLREFKEYIDNEMIVILGQMDRPTEIFEHVYLGSEWNASNLEELQNTGVQYILNVTREIDNFFPGLFEYHNIRVYDEEATDLLAYWNDTYKFISRAKKAGAKCLVHCKMGVSRSASTVIAYAMKEYGWDLEQAFEYVKERRAVTKPNPSFMRQLEEYQGILMASKQRHNKLWRSHSDSDLSEHHEPLCKATAAQSLGRSYSRNQTFGQTSPSIQELLQTLTPTSASATEAKGQTEPDTIPWPDTHIYNGLGNPDDNLHEPTENPSLPRPRAATVVPEARSDVTSMTIAETFPLGRPHPPAAVHNPPSSPRLLSDAKTMQGLSEQLEVSILVPLEKSSPKVLSSVSIRSRTPEPCTQTPDSSGLQDISQQVPNTETDCVGLSYSSDEDHHPSATLHRAGLSITPPLTLSTDRIDFFSAREKFQGLSQEGQICGTSEQVVQQTPRDKSPSIETKRLLPDNPINEEEQKKESCSVSVHNIVSEMDSIRHSVTPPPPATSQPVSSSSSEEEEFTQATSEEAEKENVEHGKDQQSNWPKGTVRRATRELEQKIKQEVSSVALVSSAPVCPSRRSPVNTSSREKSEETSSHTHLTPDPSTVSTRHHQPQNNMDKVEKDESLSADEDRMGRECERQLREGERMNTGLTHSRQSHSISSSSSLAMVLQLEGITEQESYTDSDCPLGRCPKDMRETWETLKKLGAFLWQVSGCSDRRLSQPWSRREQRKGRAARERTKEVEVRIRQAGLTPPSMMKRSASLAKLGSLELSPVDLSELDLSPALLSAPTNKPRPHFCSDDTSKKKRVLPHCTPAVPYSSAYPISSTGSHMLGHAENDDKTEEAEYSDYDVMPMPLPLSPPSNQCWRRDNAQEEACYAQLPASALITVATRQQYGRTHPLQRLKKQTINPYHTM